MDILKLAAFSDGDAGGNPAGVVLIDTLPRAEEMQTVAADVGFSETVFAEPLGDHSSWRVRYFSPESEVPFCGHATIALGAALAGKYGDGRFALHLNAAKISVEGAARDGGFVATLLSPPTHSEAGAGVPLDEVLGLFGFTDTQLDPHIPPARIHGGADHIVLALRSRDDLASMQYDLDAGRALMAKHGLVTIMLVWSERADVFHVRNAFASGGVLEDPATGAAAAASPGICAIYRGKAAMKSTLYRAKIWARVH